MKLPGPQQEALKRLFDYAEGENVWLHVEYPTNPLSLQTEFPITIRIEQEDFEIHTDGSIWVWRDFDGDAVPWEPAKERVS